MPCKKTFGEKMGGWVRYILSCCDEDGEEEARPALQIGNPTNFRREDITIPGLDPEQQSFIRAKAISDAQKMWSTLRPLASSPSNHFASPTNPLTANMLHPYTDNTTTAAATAAPASPPSSGGGGGGQRRSSGGAAGGWERVRAHSRKISSSFTKPLGYVAVENGSGGVGEAGRQSRFEMRALMESGGAAGECGPGKSSGESFSVEGSEEGKEMGRV